MPNVPERFLDCSGAATRNRVASLVKSAGQVYENDGSKYDVEKLWELSKKLPVERLALEDAQSYLDADSWPGGKTPREVISSKDDEHGHLSRINAADLRHPIILAPGQGMADGMHRLAKAHMLGRDTVPVRSFPSWEDMEDAKVANATGDVLQEAYDALAGIKTAAFEQENAMSDDLFRVLTRLRDSISPREGGSDLEMMGKKAADMWSSGDADSLSDAVVQTVKRAGLNNEKVRRVIEFTNIDAYNREFKKMSSSKVVDFDGGPADPSVIFKDLNTPNSTVSYDAGGNDYSTAPNEKTAGYFSRILGRGKGKQPQQVSMQQAAPNAAPPMAQPTLSPEHAAFAEQYQLEPSMVDDELSAMKEFGMSPSVFEHNLAYLSALQKSYGGPGVSWDEQKWGYPDPTGPMSREIESSSLPKVACRKEKAFEQMFASDGAGYPEENPFGEVMYLKDKLAGHFDEMTDALNQLEVGFQGVNQDLFHQVKQAAMSGHSLSEIVRIWDSVAPDPVFVKMAMGGMLDRLIDNGVFTGEGAVESLQKVAGSRVVNSTHPLVSEFMGYCEVLSKLASIREQRDEVGNAVGDLTEFLKAAGVSAPAAPGAGIDWKGMASNVGSAVGKATKKSFGWAGGAGQLAGSLVGADPNSAISRRLGQAALVGAVGLGANELYRNTLKYNPTWRSGVQKVRQAIPGTDEYYAREYQLATGQ